MNFTVSSPAFIEPILRFILHTVAKKPGEFIPHQPPVPPLVLVDGKLIEGHDLTAEQRLAILRDQEIHLTPAQAAKIALELPPMWFRDP